VITNLTIGLGVGLIIGWLGQRLRYLTRRGWLGVTVTIAITFWAGGWVWGVGISTFYLTALLWTYYRSSDKQPVLAHSASGQPQDMDQVIARAGWAVLLAVCYACVAPHLILFAAYIGVLATASADLWATQLGVLSTIRPRLLTSGRRVAPGVAGGISLLGLIAALMGAWSQGLLALLATSLRSSFEHTPRDMPLIFLPIAATLGGLAGCLTDSLLGATAQGIFYCEACDAYCETRQHVCGNTAQQIRGWAWLTNEGVDFVSSLVGAAVTAGIINWLARL
jgi:uncharacterized protein (TIGR00297 family)